MSEVVGAKVYDLVTSGAWKGHVAWLGDGARMAENERMG